VPVALAHRSLNTHHFLLRIPNPFQGANGWRTAHNPPNPALLDAADALGFLVWDESHRNGILSELETLVLRDRNHPR
jgi:hypothetical protein